MRVGIAHHLGWAVAVTVTSVDEVIDRRRIELVESGLPAAPIHHDGGFYELHRPGDPLDDVALGALVERVEASVRRATGSALDELVADLGRSITAIAVRAWPDDLPTEIAVLRRPPYESKVDSFMYCRLIAAEAEQRGCRVVRYDARRVVTDALRVIGADDDGVLARPRLTLGAPWAKDHRLACAAAIVAGASGT
jgi:hypothetical protein